jgi:hypothetical protein
MNHGLNLLCILCFLDNYIASTQVDISLFITFYWDSTGSYPFYSIFSAELIVEIKTRQITVRFDRVLLIF